MAFLRLNLAVGGSCGESVALRHREGCQVNLIPLTNSTKCYYDEKLHCIQTKADLSLFRLLVGGAIRKFRARLNFK